MTGAITLWVPLAVFALLAGLSMDYEVFILTRINEEYESAGDIGQAVIRGMGHTGRLVSSGALILCLAFIALGGVPQTDVKILSAGLAAGIIVDATISSAASSRRPSWPSSGIQLVAPPPHRPAPAGHTFDRPGRFPGAGKPLTLP